MKQNTAFYFAIALMLVLLFYGIRILQICNKNEKCLANLILPPPSYDSLQAAKPNGKHGKYLSQEGSHDVAAYQGSAHQATYVTCYQYVGQQGAGVRSLASLLCFLKSLKMLFLLAEPQIEKSTIIGYPGKNGLNFSDVFNIDAFTERSQEMGHPDMISMMEYINNPLKYKIIVKVVSDSIVNAVLWKSQSVSGKVKCLRYNDNKLRDDTKCVVRVVQISPLLEALHLMI